MSSSVGKLEAVSKGLAVGNPYYELNQEVVAQKFFFENRKQRPSGHGVINILAATILAVSPSKPSLCALHRYELSMHGH